MNEKQDNRNENELLILKNRVKGLEELVHEIAQGSRCVEGGGPPRSLTSKVEFFGNNEMEATFIAPRQMTWDCWYRSEGCRDWMDRTSFAGVNYTAIFYDAMRMLFFDENGQRGLLYQNGISAHAGAIVNQNGRRNGFDVQQEAKMLLLGEYPAYGIWRLAPDRIAKLNLRVEGPGPNHAGIYASATIGGTLIEFNFYNHIQVAQQLEFPNDATGVDRIKWMTAATMLHEMMHNNGYSHPIDVDYAWGSDYASSLPFVAELAVLRASPYWTEFSGYYQTHAWLNLTDSPRRTCGAN